MEAAKELRENPDFFTEGRRWTFERSYEVASVVGRYVSVLRDDGSYAGGAHPNSRTDTILWDRDRKKRVSMRPFFKETADNGPSAARTREPPERLCPARAGHDDFQRNRNVNGDHRAAR